jgi:hypothetical protein
MVPAWFSERKGQERVVRGTAEDIVRLSSIASILASALNSNLKT